MGGGQIPPTDNIYVVDTDQSNMMESRIKCPAKTQYHAFIAPKLDLQSNYDLSSGYVRQYIDIDIFVPIDIINLIASWLFEDHLYLLKNEGHWKINVADIL